MNKRKRIALLTALPESKHAQRVVDGISAQCLKYDYDLAVFCAMTSHNSVMENYTTGEQSIYDLPNYDEFDGVILDTASLLNGDGSFLDVIYKKISENCRKPVVALDMPIHDIPLVATESDCILREMCRHAVLHHGKKRICVITGPKTNYAAVYRMNVYLDELHRLGIDVPEEYQIYSDFWYFGGSSVGQDIIDGKLPMPEAVICGNDFLAMGLIYRLSKNGVKIPDDIIVLGYEATDEALGFQISVSSFESNDALSAANCVDELRKQIEPDMEIQPYESKNHFHPGMSCGCQPDYSRSIQAIHDHLYFTYPNYADDEMLEHINIGLLMESYVSEEFTASPTVEECIEKILLKSYLLFPLLNFFVCLNEDWLNEENDANEGYTERMKIVCANTTINELYFHKDSDSILFETKKMLPRMIDNNDEMPSVFYFIPVHFDSTALGYAAIQRRLDDPHRMNLVVRNWIRFMNNALEMARAKKKLFTLSVRDEMTGALNRRGMYIEVDKMLEEASDDSSILVCVIDMDRLKYINDTFGHAEGDYSIRTISSAGLAVTENNEIFVRAGGDEFYLIGVGNYSTTDAKKRADDLTAEIEKRQSAAKKPYPITASIGTAVSKINKSFALEDIITRADEMMYKQKMIKKHNGYNFRPYH